MTLNPVDELLDQIAIVNIPRRRADQQGPSDGKPGWTSFFGDSLTDASIGECEMTEVGQISASNEFRQSRSVQVTDASFDDPAAGTGVGMGFSGHRRDEMPPTEGVPDSSTGASKIGVGSKNAFIAS
ncbi:hypothetical protein U8335_09010 [Roseiconus lacunae]|uniref:hypothetical protein n=1 Tax=Roseiconus lacunae TaxID=2605694 RepID=UPI00308A2833|nr:hypothetical protein U8335_09010 [Stieleria sp. HD01]